MRDAASSTSKSSQTIVGDFPPSSRVTGVRFSAADRITVRPASADPVKMRWSKGRVEKSCAGTPGRTATVSSGNSAWNRSASSLQRCWELDAILIMARLPAESRTSTSYTSFSLKPTEHSTMSVRSQLSGLQTMIGMP